MIRHDGKDLEMGGSNDSVSDLEIQEFFDQVQSVRARLLMKFYLSESVREVKARLHFQDQYSEIELRRFLFRLALVAPKKLSAYLALGAGYVMWNQGISISKGVVPELIKPSLSPLAFVVSMELLSPMLEPFTAWLRNSIFNLSKSKNELGQKSVSEDLISIWYRTQEQLTSNEEMGRKTLQMAEDFLNLWLARLDRSLYKASLNSEDIYPEFVDKVASLVVRFNRRFSDIDPLDGGLHEMFQEWFEEYRVLASEKTVGDIQEAIRKKDFHYDKNKNYYQYFLLTWIPKEIARPLKEEREALLRSSQGDLVNYGSSQSLFQDKVDEK